MLITVWQEEQVLVVCPRHMYYHYYYFTGNERSQLKRVNDVKKLTGLYFSIVFLRVFLLFRNSEKNGNDFNKECPHYWLHCSPVTLMCLQAKWKHLVGLQARRMYFHWEIDLNIVLSCSGVQLLPRVIHTCCIKVMGGHGWLF